MDRYLLCLDLGNSTLALGASPIANVDEDRESVLFSSYPYQSKTANEQLYSLFNHFLRRHQIKKKMIQACTIASVVPHQHDLFVRIKKALDHSCPIYFIQKEYKYRDFFFKNSYRDKYTLGADRIANIVAASKIYNRDLIVADFGTATSFQVIHDGNIFIGGCIAPGLNLSLESLLEKSSLLPRVTFSNKKIDQLSIVSIDTRSSLEAGFYYAWLGMIKEILNRIKQTHSRKYLTIATGGRSVWVVNNFPDLFKIADPLLTIRGLRIIYRYLICQKK